jgi:hypothetical protein
MSPQTVQLFDFAIAFGFGDRQEDKFDTQIQTQPNKLAEDARRFVTATRTGPPWPEARDMGKSSVVVELQKPRDSQGFPSLKTVPNHSLAAFVGSDRLRAGSRMQI